MKHLYDRMWGRVSPVDRMSRVIVAVVLLAAGAIIALSVTKEDEATGAAGTPAKAKAAQLPMCRDVKVPADKAVACRTSKKTLYIGAEDVPILLETTQLRVIDVRSARRRAIVRVRLRNTSGRPQNTGKGAREVYLNVAGRQMFANPRPEVSIADGEAETVPFTFRFDAGDVAALRRAKGRTELAMAPFGAGGAGKSTTLAVARLRVSVARIAAPAPRPAATPAAPAAPTTPVQPAPGTAPG
jgi:hypothetical protein